MAEAKIIPEQIHLLDIKTVQANLNRDVDSNLVATASEFDVRHAQHTQFDDENHRVAVSLLIESDALGKKNKILGRGNFELFFLYQVDNLKDFLTEVKGVTKMDMVLAATLVGISFSTARGMLLTFTRNTIFEGLILPVVSPTSVITEPTAKVE